MKHEQFLVVDDSKLTRTMIKCFTNEHQPNWEVIEASSGEEALALINNKCINWVTIDFSMPEMDGLALASKLKVALPHANIALLTANIQTSTREKANALGLTYIPKPVTEAKIKSYICELT